MHHLQRMQARTGTLDREITSADDFYKAKEGDTVSLSYDEWKRVRSTHIGSLIVASCGTAVLVGGGVFLLMNSELKKADARLARRR